MEGPRAVTARPIPGARALGLIRQNVLTCGTVLLEMPGKARPSTVIASLSLERHKLLDSPRPSHHSAISSARGRWFVCPESTSGEGQGTTVGKCLWCCSPLIPKLRSATCVQVEWYLPLEIISSFISQYLENWTLDIFLL